MSSILIVDDDATIRRSLEILLRGDGHEVRSAATGEAALDLAARAPVDIVLLDLRLPGISGEEVLGRLREQEPSPVVIIITAHGSVESAVVTMKGGASDYLTKPFSPDEVRVRIAQLERLRELRAEVAGLRRRLGEMPFGGRFLTQHDATLGMLEQARRVAASDATVLLAGESGVGKSLLARLIHDDSPRSSGPFVTVDCAALHESLLESELFGHRRGAFTSAVEDRAGKVEHAQTGTLFLDEVGEVPQYLQGKLLRLVEDRTYSRLGDERERTADVRVVAATNRDLESMVTSGDFRADLFFRLSVVELTIAPLRSRSEDTLLLARELLPRLAETHGRAVSRWSSEVERALMVYSWPGNVRELAHVIERAVLLAEGPALGLADLPDRVRASSAGTAGSAEPRTLAAVEEAHLRAVLERGLSLEETAELLGIDVSTLRRKRRRLGL